MTLNKTTADLQCFLHGRGESLVKLKFYTRGLIGEGRNREGAFRGERGLSRRGLIREGPGRGPSMEACQKRVKDIKEHFSRETEQCILWFNT